MALDVTQSFSVYPQRVSSHEFDPDVMTENDYRQWLDANFKCIFEPHESDGGIPCRDLLALMQLEDGWLPKEKRNNLILKMDSNKDGRIKFEEFRSALINVRYKDLSKHKRFGLRLILAINPGLRLFAAKSKATDHLQQIETVGRLRSYNDHLPNILTGSNVNTSNRFQLEPDGVWPTSMQTCTQSSQIPVTKEEYIPASYLELYNCKPPPIFIPLMVLVQIIMFIYYAVLLKNQAGSNPDNTVTWFSGFPNFSVLYYDPRRRREVWRLFTYIFVHQGIAHILFNSITTLLFGLLIEWVYKLWRIGTIYMAGVVGSSLACSVMDPYAVLAGSSGGAYSLIGSHLALTLINWEELKHDWHACNNGFIGLASSGVTRVCLILLVVGVDFAFALYRRYGLHNNLTVSAISHVFGFLSGILIGIPMLKNIREKPWGSHLFWISICIYFLFIIFAVFWNIFWPRFPAQLV